MLFVEYLKTEIKDNILVLFLSSFYGVVPRTTSMKRKDITKLTRILTELDTI